MRCVWWCALAALASTVVLNSAPNAQTLPTPEAIPAAAVADPACTSFQAFVGSDCALTWHGITLYGAYDIGVGWVSHGLPENGYNYEGEALVNRNGNHAQFLIAPNNLSQTAFGIKGKVEFMEDWFAVFNASTGINPQSGQLANMAATNTTNSGLPRSSYSETGDGARAGQAFNDELYGGASSAFFGTLTFGRQRALGTDAMLAYDPAGGAYSAQGGYLLSGVEDHNLDSPKTVQIWWTGVKYAFDIKTDVTLSYYRQQQNDFRIPSALLARRRLPRFLLGRPERGVALYGSSLHQAFRCLCRYYVF